MKKVCDLDDLVDQATRLVKHVQELAWQLYERVSHNALRDPCLVINQVRELADQTCQVCNMILHHIQVTGPFDLTVKGFTQLAADVLQLTATKGFLGDVLTSIRAIFAQEATVGPIPPIRQDFWQ